MRPLLQTDTILEVQARTITTIRLVTGVRLTHIRIMDMLSLDSTTTRTTIRISTAVRTVEGTTEAVSKLFF
jgi:hypothetical protein